MPGTGSWKSSQNRRSRNHRILEQGAVSNGPISFSTVVVRLFAPCAGVAAVASRQSDEKTADAREEVTPARPLIALVERQLAASGVRVVELEMHRGAADSR